MRFRFLIILLMLSVSGTAKDLQYSREVSFGAAPGKRTPALKEVQIYAEHQPYNPGSNYMRFIDRPLYNDTSLREEGAQNVFLRDAEIGAQYGLNGFGGLSYLQMYLKNLKTLEGAGMKGFAHMLVLTPDSYPARYKEFRDTLIKAGKSACAPRIDGKILCWSYGDIYGTKLNQMTARLQQDKEVPPLAVFGNVPYLREMYRAYFKNRQKIPPEVILEYQKRLRDALEIFDGIQMRLVDFSMDETGEYPSRAVTSAIFDKYLLPATLEVMAEPRYRKKMLGAYINHSYTNHFDGPVVGEYGTAQIRKYLDTAIQFNPDVLVLFEWNEFNENTCFEPTVANGRTMERIVNYYRALLDGKEPQPRPGDDTSIPNLVLSIRQTIRLGEPYHIELLNIPDGRKNTVCHAQITLKNAAGEVIGRLPGESIPADKLAAYSYRIPSEQFPSEPLILAELTVKYQGVERTYSGFDYTRLSATTGWNYKYTRSALREMLPVKNTTFQVAPAKDGRVSLTAAVQSEEELSSFEILECGREVAAADREKEFDRDKYELFRGVFCSPHYKSSWNSGGTMKVTGSQDWKLRSANSAYECFKSSRKADHVEARIYFQSSPATFLLAVGKQDIDKARLCMDFEKIGHHEIDLKEILSSGKKVFALPEIIRLQMERLDVLGDLPRPLRQTSTAIRTVLHPQFRFPVYQIRAVSKTGKIFRSEPKMLKPFGGTVCPLEIYSETLRKPMTVSVHSARIPDICYVFNPQGGAFLRSGFEPQFDAGIGGGWFYAEPLFNRKALPEDIVSHPVPQWVREGDRWCLEFNGSNHYLILPLETIPKSAVFTIEFEIKTDSAENQVLLRSKTGNFHATLLQLILENGKLRGAFFGRDRKTISFPTDLAVEPGKWHKIQVVKTLSLIRFSVDGKQQTFPCVQTGRYFQNACFGGPVLPGPGIPEKIQWFKGRLRALRIFHQQEKLKQN